MYQNEVQEIELLSGLTATQAWIANYFEADGNNDGCGDGSASLSIKGCHGDR